MTASPLTQTPAEIKSCCAALYQSDWVQLILGDSFHPGGLALTKRLGDLLKLQPGQRVLDVAAGGGTSALFLANQFGCQVIGVEYGAEAVRQATDRAAEARLAHLVSFEQGDAENLHFAPASFDAVICECAFCTFPDKTAAAAEFARVLRPGGQAGLSDLTRNGPLPPELDGLLAWIACIADARPVEDYLAHFEEAGLAPARVEAHNDALSQMIQEAQIRLLAAELLVKLKNLDLPGVELNQAKELARSAARAVEQGRLGYALLIGQKA